jgi:hypothetical protein
MNIRRWAFPSVGVADWQTVAISNHLVVLKGAKISQK